MKKIENKPRQILSEIQNKIIIKVYQKINSDLRFKII